MIISVQDLFDEPLFSQMTDEDCEAYLWWEARIDNAFAATYAEWSADPLYDDFNTVSVLVIFWDKLRASIRLQMLDKVKGNPACCRIIYARVVDPIGISLDYLTIHGSSDGTDMSSATRSRERLIQVHSKVPV